MDKELLLTERDIVPYLKAKYPHMYKGNDEAWCRMRESALLLLLKSYDTELILDAQVAKVKQHYPIMFEEEAELDGFMLRAGWMTPFEAEERIKTIALETIEGMILVDEPDDPRLNAIYRFAHVALGRCQPHEDWAKELYKAYKQLQENNIL